MNLINTKDPVVVVNTNYGAIFVELYQANAPITTTNFLSYVNQGFYTNVAFHRVDLSTNVVQGGGYQLVNTASGSMQYQLKTTSTAIALENTGYNNKAGTIGMARTMEPDTATSQFYFNLTDNPGLDGNATTSGYAVFGSVISGWDVVETISKANLYSKSTVPYTPVAILSASVYSDPTAATSTTSYTQSKFSDLGVAAAIFSGKRSDYSIVANSDGSLNVQNLTGHYSVTHITSINRLAFIDSVNNTKSYYAFDVTNGGDAGKIAELIGTAFGRSYINQSGLVSLGLQYLEQYKLPFSDLCDLVVRTNLFQEQAGGSDNTAFVNLVYKNITGQTPDTAILNTYKNLLDNHTYTQGSLLEAATHYSDNAIDLIGLSHTGICFG